MNYFADGILSNGELAGLIVYLLVCGGATILITIFGSKAVYSLVKHKVYSKKHLLCVAVGIASLILANLFIEL